MKNEIKIIVSNLVTGLLIAGIMLFGFSGEDRRIREELKRALEYNHSARIAITELSKSVESTERVNRKLINNNIQQGKLIAQIREENTKLREAVANIEFGESEITETIAGIEYNNSKARRILEECLRIITEE